MPRLSFSVLFLAAFTASAALLAPVAASAQNAEDLRRTAMACEQPDGFMRALDPSAAAAVQAVNDQRRQFYQQRATQERVELAAVAAVYAQEIRSQPNFRACP